MTAILPNINFRRTDIEIYPAVRCNVYTNESVTFQSEGKQRLLKDIFIGLRNTTKFNFIWR